MKTKNLTHLILNYLFALVWLINGLYCKVLNQVPRHQEIVANILGNEYAQEFTIAIGYSEIIMAIWILSNWKPKLNAAVQIGVVGIMNILEFILVPELLLWGPYNSLFALLFMGVVYYHAFQLKISKQA